MAIESQTLCFLSLGELSALLRKREITSVETTRAVLDRIHKLNPTIRAYLTVLDDLALRQAEAADREIAAGRWRGPLHGVPVAVKDLCWTKGIPTTCASKVLRDWRPDSNATIVDRFEAARRAPWQASSDRVRDGLVSSGNSRPAKSMEPCAVAGCVLERLGRRSRHGSLLCGDRH